MKKLCLALIATIGFVCTLFGQYTSISFDLEKNYFNEGQSLPAEKPLMFNGLVPEGINIIEISIFPAKAKSDKDRLYVATWKDMDNTANTNFSLAVNYPLRAAEKYDFRLDYFQAMGAAQKTQLRVALEQQLKAYLQANISLKGNAIVLAKKEKKMVAELEQIVLDQLDQYRSQQWEDFAGFSLTVQQQLEKLAATDFAKVRKDSTVQEQRNQREFLLSQYLNAVETVMVSEVQTLMDNEWSQLLHSRYVDDYQTENKRGFFSLSLGYGGVYLDGPVDNFSYGAAAYAGVAFPLSNSTIAPRFLRNSSVVMGVFLEDFEDAEGREVTGLLVGKPIYLGLDYKLFEFVRFNAGAAFLEKRIDNTGTGPNVDQNTTKAFIRPFVGLSARIDLSIGFGK